MRGSLDDQREIQCGHDDENHPTSDCHPGQSHCGSSEPVSYKVSSIIQAARQVSAIIHRLWQKDFKLTGWAECQWRAFDWK